MASKEGKGLTRLSSDTSLMPPPPITKRIKRPAQVLDEDVYSSALSHIIARDFFPGLLEGEAQEEYLTAVASKDSAWIREAGTRMTQVMTPGPDGRRRGGTDFTPRRTDMYGDQTPITGGRRVTRTPMPTNIDFEEESASIVDVNMSLGTFQAKYTSEDNESFNELLDKQNTRRATRYAHFQHGNKIPTARQIAYRAATDEQTQQLRVVRNADGEERQLLSAGRPSQNLDDRPATLDSFPDRQGPRNTFMFGPDSVEDQVMTVAMQAEARSNAPLRRTNYQGTRFGSENLDISQRLPSPTMSAIDAAIAGRPRQTASSVGYNGAETPRVNGYAFVDAEPTPAELGVPVSEEEVDAAEKEAFDKLLPKVEDGGPNPFTITQRSRREDIHAKLVDKADAARRKGGRIDDLRRLGITPGRTPTPSFATAPRQAGQMTPAARQLAARLATPKRGWR